MSNTILMNSEHSRVFNNYHCESCQYCKEIPHEWRTIRICTAPFIRDENGLHIDDCNKISAVEFLNGGDIDTDTIMYACADIVHTSHRLRYCDDIDMYATDYCYNSSAGEHVTREYAENELYYCENCGNYYEYYDYDTECGYCCNCKSEMLIGGWHDHKGEFFPIGAPFETISDDTYLHGIEFEIDNGNDAYCVARDINNAFPNVFVFEEDGSLDDGVECITQPMTRAFWNHFNLERFTDICKSHGFKSHDTRTCGMHVHYSRSCFGADSDEQTRTLANVIRFYEFNFDTLAKLSRRERFGYCERNSKECDFEYHEIDFDDDGEIIDGSRYSRYCAVNCSNFWRNANTCEFRMARGTLNPKTIRAWINLHYGIIEFCKHADYHKCGADALTWDAFINSEYANANLTKSDSEYLESKLG